MIGRPSSGGSPETRPAEEEYRTTLGRRKKRYRDVWIEENRPRETQIYEANNYVSYIIPFWLFINGETRILYNNNHRSQEYNYFCQYDWEALLAYIRSFILPIYRLPFYYSELPHSIYGENFEVCLIVKDPKEEVKKLLEANNITTITKVILL